MSRSVSFAPATRLAYDSLEEAFPNVDPGRVPLGTRVQVQIMTPKTRTAGGIELPPEVQDTIAWNTVVGKVIAVGPVAFKNRTTLEPWPEGAWVKPGDFVCVPKYGGARYEMPIEGRDGMALFVTFNDLDLTDLVTIDPRKIIAFV